MKKDPLGGLAQSLQDENAAVENRFERADRILGEQGSPPGRKRLSSATPFLFPISITCSYPSYSSVASRVGTMLPRARSFVPA